MSAKDKYAPPEGPPFDTLRYNIHLHQKYLSCPRSFLYSYKRMEPPVKQNRYYAIAGDLVQKFFEMYANHWIGNGADVSPASVRRKMEPHWQKLLQYNFVDWGHPMSRLSEPDLFSECLDTINNNLEALDIYDNVKAEAKFELTLKSGDILVAKIDFIKGYGEEGAVILDGKNSNKMGKNVDPRQLLFYALLYKFKFGVYPKKIGFVYYKHLRIEYIDFTELEADNLWKEIVQTIIHIKNAKTFPPTPSAKNCKYCDYLEICEEGKADRDSRKRGPVDVMKDVKVSRGNEGLFKLEV